jgi:hypothetical protein
VGVLPQRKLTLARRFVAARLAVALAPSLPVAALGAWALSLAGEDAHRLLTQEELAAHGVEASHPRVDIERDAALMMFRARRYEVAFEDASGRAHSTTVREHDLSITPLVVEGPPHVRYDPEDPSRVSVAFARQNVRAQWAAVALLSSVGVLALAIAAWLALRLSRPLRAAWSLATRRQERIAKVLSSQPFLDSSGARTGALHLTLALEDGPVAETATYRALSVHAEAPSAGSASRALRRPVEVVTSADDPPVYLGAREHAALVLTREDGEGAPLVVRRSGHPFVLTADERVELAARVEALRSRPGAELELALRAAG